MPFLDAPLRMAVRAVKAAQFAFTGAKRTALTEQAGGEAHSYGRKGKGRRMCVCDISDSRNEVKGCHRWRGQSIQARLERSPWNFLQPRDFWPADAMRHHRSHQSLRPASVRIRARPPDFWVMFLFCKGTVILLE